MTRYLILDTETNRIFDWSKPADAPGACSIGIILADADLAVEQEHEFLIKPEDQ